MGKRHRPPRKLYQLRDSPLHKCRSRARLACLLGEGLPQLEQLAESGDGYRIFQIVEGYKSRTIQQPLGLRERVHLRLFNLLRRVRPPDYLHSGVNGRSYVTNAKTHVGDHPLLKLDIKSFYESATHSRVFSVFRDQFRCDPDVSALLTRLCCYDGHIPTGSSLSQILAFFALKMQFDQFSALCRDDGVTFTVYVDDITISGIRASRRLLFALKKALVRSGFSYHKEKHYRAQDNKLVTGVVISGNEVRVRNRHHLQIRSELHELLGEVPSKENVRRYESLLGRIASSLQIDPKLVDRREVLKLWKESALP